MSSKRVVGSSENRAEVGAGFSFGLRKCRWAALGVPQSDPGSPVLRPWPETSAICRIPCISAVQGLGPSPAWKPQPPAPLYCFLSFLPPCFDQLAARRTWGSADWRGLRPHAPTPQERNGERRKNGRHAGIRSVFEPRFTVRRAKRKIVDPKRRDRTRKIDLTEDARRFGDGASR